MGSTSGLRWGWSVGVVMVASDGTAAEHVQIDVVNERRLVGRLGVGAVCEREVCSRLVWFEGRVRVMVVYVFIEAELRSSDI